MLQAGARSPDREAALSESMTNANTSRFEALIKPAILKLVAETEGSYRCERDLHHHLTVCLNQIISLRLGTAVRVVFFEQPGKACYGTGRNGNIDFFFPGPFRGCGTAVELNYNYDSIGKIVKDIQKLIDPQNGYTESVYFAFGKKPGFGESIRRGIERAYQYFAGGLAGFALPVGFNTIIAERQYDLVRVTLAGVSTPCSPGGLVWSDLAPETGEHDLNRGEDAAPGSAVTMTSSNGVDSEIVPATISPLRAQKARLGREDNKAWLHWPAPQGPGCFLAFVNQKGSCSKRRFDAKSGELTGKPDYPGTGRFQEHFQHYLQNGKLLRLSRQPNLEKECKPKLPADVLAELQRQIGL